jgi:hypothetical protein
MPLSLKEILESEKIPGDRQFDVPLGDGEKVTLTVGELRAHVKGIHGDVAERENSIAQLLQANDEANRNAQAQQAAALQQAEVSRSSTAQTAFDYEHDPFTSPIWSRLTANERSNQELREALRQLSQGTAAQVAAAIDLEQRNAFSARSSEFPGIEFEAARKYAADNRILNQRGIIDPLKAAHEMSAPARLEAEKKASFEAGRKAREKELQDSIQAQGIPMISLPGFARNTGQEAFKVDPKAGLQGNLKAALQKAWTKPAA